VRSGKKEGHGTHGQEDSVSSKLEVECRKKGTDLSIPRSNGLVFIVMSKKQAAYQLRWGLKYNPCLIEGKSGKTYGVCERKKPLSPPEGRTSRPSRLREGGVGERGALAPQKLRYIG